MLYIQGLDILLYKVFSEQGWPGKEVNGLRSSRSYFAVLFTLERGCVHPEGHLYLISMMCCSLLAALFMWIHPFHPHSSALEYRFQIFSNTRQLLHREFNEILKNTSKCARIWNISQNRAHAPVSNNSRIHGRECIQMLSVFPSVMALKTFSVISAFLFMLTLYLR